MRRAVSQIKNDELTDRAAALTYYGVQAIFPGALVLVSVLGLLGSSTTQTLVDNIGQVAPGAVKSVTEKVITTAQAGRGQAGIGAIVGIVLALWSASAYVAASCGPPMPSTVSARAGRSGRPRRCDSW